MPFNCDVCGEEVSYNEPVFVLRNNAEIVICRKCIKKELKKRIIWKMRCPKCNNPYYRHKGKKRRLSQVMRPYSIGLKKFVHSVVWSEEGYYCKRCKYETST